MSTATRTSVLAITGVAVAATIGAIVWDGGSAAPDVPAPPDIGSIDFGSLPSFSISIPGQPAEPGFATASPVTVPTNVASPGAVTAAPVQPGAAPISPLEALAALPAPAGGTETSEPGSVLRSWTVAGSPLETVRDAYLADLAAAGYPGEPSSSDGTQFSIENAQTGAWFLVSFETSGDQVIVEVI